MRKGLVFGAAGFLSFWAYEFFCPRATFWGKVKTHASREVDAVGLLFERCPNKNTIFHVELMLDHNVPGTMFIEELRARDYPEPMRLMKLFELGVHGRDNSPLIFKSRFEIRKRLRGAMATAHDLAGRQPKFLMPPKGLKDITLLKEASSLGLTVILPRLRLKRGQRFKDPVDNLLEKVLPGDFILIPENTSPRDLEQLIIGLRSLGLGCWGLSALI